MTSRLIQLNLRHLQGNVLHVQFRMQTISGSLIYVWLQAIYRPSEPDSKHVLLAEQKSELQHLTVKHAQSKPIRNLFNHPRHHQQHQPCL